MNVDQRVTHFVNMLPKLKRRERIRLLTDMLEESRQAGRREAQAVMRGAIGLLEELS